MKKTTIVIAVAAALAVALATFPALAQTEQPADQPSAECPFHDDRESMTSQDMEQWMDSPAHDDWMNSANHDRMHAAMGNMEGMTGSYGPGPGNMMGGMMGASSMMGSSR